MYKYSSDNPVKKIESKHGETVFELIGPNAGDATQRHSVAYVEIPPGKSSLLHFHKKSEESYYILKGEAQIILGDEQETIMEGECVLIPSLKKHQIINIGSETLKFIAVCIPAWESTDSFFEYNNT